jgi:soluble lytic murein transglycosylase-like protein
MAWISLVQEASATPLSELFLIKGKGDKKVLEKWDRLPLPPEYAPYLRAKTLVEARASLGALDRVEQDLLLAPREAESRNLLKEIEDHFHILELRRGTLLAKQGSRKRALSAFHRGLNGLGTFKWVLYWNLDASQSLASICVSGKKKTRDEECLLLARRLMDVFPKAANEMKPLKELPAPEGATGAEVGGERISQTYSERYEKDEDAFLVVLDDFLAGRDSDLMKSAKQFSAEYPRSYHRFRAQFMMAETHYRNRREKEAAPLYRSIIEQVPLSYYAVVSSERIGVSLKDAVVNHSPDVDLDHLALGPYEKRTLDRAKSLLARKQMEEVGIELDSLTRLRNYSTHFLLTLMRLGSLADQNLTVFKVANELMQRKYDGMLTRSVLELVFPDRFEKEIIAEAERTGIDPVTITSLIKQESGFKAGAISISGALGLMQLMPFTALDVKKDLMLGKLRDPVTNIGIGSKYLQSLLEKYSGNLPYALAAYNAGPHRVAKWKKEIKPEWSMIQFIESIPYRETREYVSSILRNRHWYQVRKGIVPAKVTDLRI